MPWEQVRRQQLLGPWSTLGRETQPPGAELFPARNPGFAAFGTKSLPKCEVQGLCQRSSSRLCQPGAVPSLPALLIPLHPQIPAKKTPWGGGSILNMKLFSQLDYKPGILWDFPNHFGFFLGGEVGPEMLQEMRETNRVLLEVRDLLKQQVGEEGA